MCNCGIDPDLAETGPIARISPYGKDAAITSTCVSAQLTDLSNIAIEVSLLAVICGLQAKRARHFEVEYKQYVVLRVMLQSTER